MATEALRNHRNTSIGLTVLAVAMTVIAIIQSGDWYIPAGMMWLACVLFWWSYKTACDLNNS